jgi:predicted Zn finger-like uncharacterized protein
MIVSCECGAKLRIDDAKITDKGTKVRCPRCGNVVPVRRPEPAAPESPPCTKISPGLPAAGPLILVAHDSDMIQTMISDVLLADGFRVDTAADGVEALQKANSIRPQGMVLDVGLPGMYGFELCARLKENPELKEIKIVLLSSVYDKRRYKRTPDDLYGADDYIEKHHVPDSLSDKFRRLLHTEHIPGKPAKIMANAPDDLFQKDECDIPKVEAADHEAVKKAQRFSRIIVSDIVLYNQKAVIEGLKNGNFYELLKTDVQEGRELYERQVPDFIKAKKDHYQEALDDFITSARRKIVR